MSFVRFVRERANYALIGSGLPAWFDRLALRRATARRRPSSPAEMRHLLVAPPGAGNIGDQALCEAFMENMDGEIVMITRANEDIHVADSHRSRVTIVTLDALLYGRGAAHRRDLLAFGDLLRRASTMSIIGADIMDGRYSVRATANRWNLARAAAELGIPAQIVGFSWNGVPTTSARRALVSASRSGVSLLLRDPISAMRVRELGVPTVVETADIVFSARGTEVFTDLDEFCSEPFAVVNVSALVGESIDQQGEIMRVVSFLLESGLRVVLLPHVSRAGSDDVPLCAAVAGAAADSRVKAIDCLLSPRQVRGLVSQAEIVVTGRMHLAVMSLWSGVPAVTLSTQGKVAGLMQLVDAPELCVEPMIGFGERIVEIVKSALPEASPTRVRIAAALPRVYELASRNTSIISGSATEDRRLDQRHGGN